MAFIEVRGYFNKPQTKSGSNGDFQTFTLAEKQKAYKDKPESRLYYDVAVFKGDLPRVSDGDYGTVKGYLSVREYKSKYGTIKQGLSINAQEIEIAEKKNSAPKDDSDPFATTD